MGTILAMPVPDIAYRARREMGVQYLIASASHEVLRLHHPETARFQSACVRACASSSHSTPCDIQTSAKPTQSWVD
eukprot:349615-Rhodomonas_salina.1